MSSLLDILKDPPPEFAFEIEANGIAMSRTRPPATLQHVPLAPGILVPSPVKQNVIDAPAFLAAIQKLIPANASRGRRGAALILPDNSVRISVLDFDHLPDKEAERRTLISFRLRKSVPFDVDDAALSYYIQPDKKSVVAVLAPAEVIAHYEAPFRAVGLQPGLVTVSSLAMLELAPQIASLVVARRSPGSLTVLALEKGALTLARSLELPDDSPNVLEEISSDLYPTLAWIEDQSGTRPSDLLIAGFGDHAEEAATRLSVELEINAGVLADPHPGLAGYLMSLAPSARKNAA